ncbi:MAG: UvrD-helicase domain-containing protein [Actinobacteria bacterium]|nr:UvrD-helicase domain-containing protein [Actinomycetota bacterium]
MRGTAHHGRPQVHVWSLFAEYWHQLQRRDVVDGNDALIKALALVRSGRLRERYAAVLIDEAHDLTEVGVRLAHAIAGGGSRDGLFLVGEANSRAPRAGSARATATYAQA